MSDEVYEDGRDLHAPWESWTRFAEVMGQRMSDRRLSKAELHRQSGLDRKTITKLQRGEQASYFLASIGKLEDALGWPRGTVKAFLEQPDRPMDRVIADIRSRQQADRWAMRDHAGELERRRREEQGEHPDDLAAEERAQMLRRAFDGATDDEADRLLLEAARLARDIRPRD